MTAPERATGAGRQSRGQKTRQAILDATLRVIADGGVRAVTHRAVAAEADVSLSLTTYHFSDIFDMVSSAFNDFVDRERPRVEQAWREVFDHVHRYSAAERRRRNIREQLRRRLTRIGVDYLLDKLQNHRAGIAVEHHFYFEALNDARLRALYETSREPVLAEMTRFAALFNRQTPELDAEILIGVILKMEHKALIDPPDDIDRQYMELVLGRVIGWIMGLQHPPTEARAEP